VLGHRESQHLHFTVHFTHTALHTAHALVTLCKKKKNELTLIEMTLLLLLFFYSLK